jgi:hypothetical protein
VALLGPGRAGRPLSGQEWGEAAAAVMDWIGFARHDDESVVRWAAVRHAPDHIHLMAMLVRLARVVGAFKRGISGTAALLFVGLRPMWT